MDPSVHETKIDPVDRILEHLGIDRDQRIAAEFLTEAMGLLSDRPDTLDLKIASAALAEMRDAFEMFRPYRSFPKVSIFGSARTRAEDPLYEHTRRVAHELARAGWMVVTGAGPGIMQAGMEGAGRERSIGVSIRLPFETGANDVIAGDPKHVSMKYFFTRKLMLVKESAAFICLPGGFGTLDETFELLTLTQTGKGAPVPIVLLDTPGDPYWEQVDEFIHGQLVSRGLVSADDVHLYRITESCTEAVDEITSFYANYHSIRFVGDDLVVRMRRGPDPVQLERLRAEFAHLAVDGHIRPTAPLAVERRQDDHVDLDRIVLRFDHRAHAGLRALIDEINTYGGDPAASQWSPP
ncbi:MAG: TIGR00730 family Rossman fold protein [Ilumatobacteraceae bacterium]